MLYVILGLIAVFLAVILIRAALFNPKPQPKTDDTPVSFDRDKAVEDLAALIRCKTVSYSDHSLEDDGEFQKLIDMLPSLYPGFSMFAPCGSCRIGRFFCAGRASGTQSLWC